MAGSVHGQARVQQHDSNPGVRRGESDPAVPRVRLQDTIISVLGGNDGEVENRVQQHLTTLEDQSGSEPEHMDMLKTAVRRAFEAKRKENVTERKNEEETRKCSREETK